MSIPTLGHDRRRVFAELNTLHKYVNDRIMMSSELFHAFSRRDVPYDDRLVSTAGQKQLL